MIRFFEKTIIASLILLGSLALCEVTSAQEKNGQEKNGQEKNGQEKKGRDDFGAESLDADIQPLPVDLVEERDRSTSTRTTAGEQVKSALATQEPSASPAQLGQRMKKILAAFESGDFGGAARIVPRPDDAFALELYDLRSDSILTELGLRNLDLILAFGEEKVQSNGQLLDILERLVENETVVLQVLREGKETIIPLTREPSTAAKGPSTPEGEKNFDQETTTVLNVNDAEIATLVKTFSKLTRRNYIVDNNVKGKISILLNNPVTVAEALRILDTVLLLKGFTTVPVAPNTWKVVSAKDARQTTIPLVKTAPDTPSDVMVTQLMRLKYVTAQDVQQLLTQFVSKDGVINAFPGTNSLVIIDSEMNIKRLQELIAELDVPALDQELTIIPILHAEAKDIAEKIEEILGDKEKSSTSAGSNLGAGPRSVNPVLTNTASQTRATSATSGAASTGQRRLPLKIIPDERTNSIIVVADEETTLKVKALVEQLDSELDRSGGKFWVYRVQHADAEELADILNEVITGTASERRESDSATKGSSLSRNRSSVGQSFDTRRTNQNRDQVTTQRTRDSANRRTGATSPFDTTAASGSTSKVNLEGEVTIAPDPATNSLIINASRGDYLKVREVIDALDVKRRQVLVEATILEVRLSKDQGMGIELQGTAGLENGGVIAQTNYGGLSNLLTNPAALTDLTIAAASTGSVTLPGGLTIPSQAVLVTAVSRLSNVNVLSAPTIMATDNEEAEIIVGENVPFVSSTSTDTSNINNTFNSIERQDVGITLRITPQLSSGDFVVLNIFVEISTVVPGTRNDPNGPTTTIRTTETTVTVKNEQMVVTGGLLQDSLSDSTRGVPFFEDIPVLGQLFKRADDNAIKTNLLIFITPKIIADQFEARESTRARTKVVEDKITAERIEPDRKEILDSAAIDRVSEPMPVDQNRLPTTLIPLPREKSSPRNSLSDAEIENILQKELSSANRESSLDKSEEGITVTVRPKLPQPKLPLPNEALNAKTPLVGDLPAQHKSATLKRSKTSEVSPSTPSSQSGLSASSGANEGANTFVVLRQTAGEPAVGAPFRLADAKNTVGLIFSGGEDSAAANFFEIGGAYSYHSDKAPTGAKPASFVCLGQFSSLTAAAEQHPGLSEQSLWYHLSPQELLTLGKRGWKREGN